MAERHGAPDEQKLIEDLRRREGPAFERAVRTYSGAMLAAARAIVGPALAEDVVQDAWLTVFRSIDGFEGRSSLGTWLHRIVVNRAISMLRSTAREVRLPESDGDSAADWFAEDGHWRQGPPHWSFDSPEALLAAAALEKCIEKHLDLMAPHQRSLVVMRDMEGMEFEEICNVLHISASNARVLLHRGRLRLVRMLDRFRETGSC